MTRFTLSSFDYLRVNKENHAIARCSPFVSYKNLQYMELLTDLLSSFAQYRLRHYRWALASFQTTCCDSNRMQAVCLLRASKSTAIPRNDSLPSSVKSDKSRKSVQRKHIYSDWHGGFVEHFSHTFQHGQGHSQLECIANCTVGSPFRNRSKSQVSETLKCNFQNLLFRKEVGGILCWSIRFGRWNHPMCTRLAFDDTVWEWRYLESVFRAPTDIYWCL